MKVYLSGSIKNDPGYIPKFEMHQEMLDCEAIAMIQGWETSQGAKLEFMVATMCGMEVIYL